MDAPDAALDGDAPAERPDIELRHLFDDRGDPSELTVFSPEAGNLTTEWVTVDRSAAVALDRMR